MDAVRRFCDRADTRLLDPVSSEARSAAQRSAEAPEQAKPPASSAAQRGAEAQEQPTRWGEGGVRHTKVSVPALLTDESTLALRLELHGEAADGVNVHSGPQERQSSGLVKPRTPG